MTTGLRATALLVVVFGAGMVVGIALDRTLLRRPVRAMLLERAAPPSVDALVQRAQRRLDLDSAQTLAVRELLQQRQPLLLNAWTSARNGLLAQVDTTFEQLTAILTPAQQARLNTLLKLRGYQPRDERSSQE